MPRTLLPVLIIAAALVAGCGSSATPPPTVDSDEITRLDRSVSGTGANGVAAGQIRLSGDGRYAVFVSAASDLVPGDTNSSLDVFRKDRTTGDIVLVSRAWGSVGTPVGNGNSDSPSISSDGDVIAFASTATNLLGVGGDTNGFADIFVVRISTGSIERASVSDTAAAQATGGASVQPDLSPDGRYVVFASAATNLTADDTNGAIVDIFRRDLLSPGTILCSRYAVTNAAATADSARPVISANGDIVAFQSLAPLAGPSVDGNLLADIYVREISAATTTRVSVATAGDANGASTSPRISGDGRYVAFISAANNLVTADGNGSADAFVRDRTLGTTIRFDVADAGGTELGAGALAVALSDDGRYLAFSTTSAAVATDTNGFSDVYVADRVAARTRRVSHATGGAQNNGDSGAPTISRDGSTVGFEATGTLLPGGEASIVHVYAALNPPTAGG